MSAYSTGILGQYEANLSQQAGTDRVATDKDTFLKLLVAQLTHQDPLNPVEDKEFIAQLAQFTTVEELQNIKAGVDGLNEAFLTQQATNAASLIGMDVIAKGSDIYLSGAANFTSQDDFPAIYFEVPRDSAYGSFNVFSTNPDGTMGRQVYSAAMGGYSAGGLHAYAWSGRNDAGEVMPDGSYTIVITAYDDDGKQMLPDTSSRGIVLGVETATDGNHKLYLHDGRTVNYKEIDTIAMAISSGGGNSEPPKTAEELEEEAVTLETAYAEAKAAADAARELADLAASTGAENAATLETAAAALEKAAENAKKAAEEAREKADAAKE